jgi:hypothetical protein
MNPIMSREEETSEQRMKRKADTAKSCPHDFQRVHIVTGLYVDSARRVDNWKLYELIEVKQTPFKVCTKCMMSYEEVESWRKVKEEP